MFVKSRMTVNPVTMAEDTPVLEASEVMRKQGFSRIPVVTKNGKLIGIVTHDDLMRVSPSSATTLSVFELNYLLSKLTLGEVMTKNPITIDEDATLEEAAVLMRDNQIGALPVIAGGRLVGIITESDIFDAFISLMGLREAGSRITVGIEDRVGVLAEITQVIKDLKINIVSMGTFNLPDGRTGELVLRLDDKNPEALVKELAARGYKVTHVVSWKERSGK